MFTLYAKRRDLHRHGFNWFFCLLVAQVFDKHNRGYITASDLRAVLQCLGEDLSEEESKS